MDQSQTRKKKRSENAKRKEKKSKIKPDVTCRVCCQGRGGGVLFPQRCDWALFTKCFVFAITAIGQQAGAKLYGFCFLSKAREMLWAVLVGSLPDAPCKRAERMAQTSSSSSSSKKQRVARNPAYYCLYIMQGVAKLSFHYTIITGGFSFPFFFFSAVLTSYYNSFHARCDDSFILFSAGRAAK